MSESCVWYARRCESVSAALTLAVEYGVCADRSERSRYERERTENTSARRGLARLLRGGET